MLKDCGIVVKNFGENLRKTSKMCTLSTGLFVIVVFRTIIVHKLNTAFWHLSAAFSQKLNHFSLAYILKFYTLSTGPINTTNLIKDNI
jgi:hypothetical protein